MNIKSISALACLLSLFLAVSLVLSGCGGGGETEGTEAPTEAPTSDETVPADTTPETDAPVEVNCTVTVTDQDGTPLTDLSVTLTPENGEAITIKTDAVGVSVVSLYTGTYSISYESLPEGYLADDSSLTVAADSTAVTIKVINNISNGTEDRPFPIVDETTTVTIPAGASYTYVMFNATNRILNIENTTLTVTYKTVEYTPDAEGNISVPLTNESPRDPGYFTLNNKGDTDVEATVTVYATPGSMENPYTVESLDEYITAVVPKETTVYYKWVATKSGVLMVTSDTENNHIFMANQTNSTVSYFTDGTHCEYINVTEGDELQIAVACKDTSVDSTDVIFKLSAYAGTAEDPIPVGKAGARFTLAAGATCVYSSTERVETLLLEGKDVKVTVNGETYTPNEEGKLEINLNASDALLIFTVENLGESRQEISISLVAPPQS